MRYQVLVLKMLCKGMRQEKILSMLKISKQTYWRWSTAQSIMPEANRILAVTYLKFRYPALAEIGMLGGIDEILTSESIGAEEAPTMLEMEEIAQIRKDMHRKKHTKEKNIPPTPVFRKLGYPFNLTTPDQDTVELPE